MAEVSTRVAFYGEIGVTGPGRVRRWCCPMTDRLSLMVMLGALKSFLGEFVDAQPMILCNVARVLVQRLRESNILVASLYSHD